MTMLGRLSLSLALAASATGCVYDGDDPDVASAEQDIINGDVISSANSGLPMLSDSNGLCSSTLLDNRWLLTAAHCVESYWDHAFDGDGQALIRFAAAQAQSARAIATDSVGRALVAGAVTTSGTTRFGLTRVRPNGSTDPYFASGAGRVTTDFPGADKQEAFAVAVDGQQRTVVAGYAHTAAGDVLALARYTSAGALDTSFGGDGRVTTDIALSTGEQGRGVAVDGQGRIIVGGHARVSGHLQWVLARYTAAGALDPSWNGNGVVITDFASTGDDYLAGIAIDGAGRVVAVGGGGEQMAVARYRSDGYLDPTFDGDGKVLVKHGGGATYGHAVAIDAQNRVVVTGEGTASSGMLLARFTTSGALDPSFDGNGWTSVSPRLSWSDASGKAVAIDSIGRIVVAGTAWSGTVNAFTIGRVEPSGAPDDTFNTVSGIIGSSAIDPARGLSYEAFATGVAIAPDGNLYLSFELDPASSPEGAFGAARLLPEFGNVPAWVGLNATMGSQTVAASRVYRHAVRDVALVRLAAPMTMNGSTTGYQFAGFYTAAPSTLVGQTLDCYGWGRSTLTGGSGTLRTADLEVDSATADAYAVGANSRGQIIYRGDSGGPCYLESGNRWLITGVSSYGNAASATQLAASAFSAWADLVRAANS